jgi:hypothetical protein
MRVKTSVWVVLQNRFVLEITFILQVPSFDIRRHASRAVSSGVLSINSSCCGIGGDYRIKGGKAL